MRIYVNTINLNKNYANLSILEKFIYIRVLIISDENDCIRGGKTYRNKIMKR